jgi:transposase-like protein
VVKPEVPSTEPKEITTVTPDQIIAHRRRRLLELAAELGNVSEACRQMGVSRTRYYEWKKLADAYGLDALTPKARRHPQLPNATPTHVVQELLTVAVNEPTIRLPPVRGPARRARLHGVQDDGAEDPGRP